MLRDLLCLGALVLLQPSLARALDNEGDDLPDLLPGLVARYSSADGTDFTRVEASVALATNDSTLRRRLSPGPVRSQWQGRLFTIAPGQYTLRVFAAGEVRINLGGHQVLHAESDEPGWLVAEPIYLEYGYHRLTIRYRQTAEPESVSLFWSGPHFGLEPVGARHLFHPRGAHPTVAPDRGRELVRALRCGACHTIFGEPPPLKAPSLDRLRGNVNYDWLVKWMARHTDGAADAPGTPAESRGNMPFFALQSRDAEALAAWLWAMSIPAGEPPMAHVNGDAQQGELLFHSLGCLACHRVDRVGAAGLFSGGDLSETGDKHPPGYFVRWLADPASVNPDHRMPRFPLSDAERANVSRYLATLRPRGGSNDVRHGLTQPEESAELIERGRRLAAEHRCGACHALPGKLEPTEQPLFALNASSDWQQGCTGAADMNRRRPGFRLTAKDQAAVARHVGSLRNGKITKQRQLDGRQVLAEQNCLACHGRGTAVGIARHFLTLTETHPPLASRLPAMSPPALDSVGDKLTDEMLASVIDGRAEPLRPWLDVRMPNFKLSDAGRRAVVRLFKQIDRVPPIPEAGDQYRDLDDAVLQVAGARLVTADGFGCTSCHQIGQTSPVNVALKSRGTDLSRLAARVRRPWYDRWLRDPARIVPRMEMPSIGQPIRGVMDNRLEDQLAAVWHVLSRPDFNPPRPDAVRVVRSRNVPGASEHASVLTDVLEIDGQVFVKPLLVALANRHNVLFDLDRASLAGWWIGDTARQRTRGKTWYWEAAGSDVVAPAKHECDVSLLIGGAAAQLERAGQFATELDSWEHVEGGIRFAHRLHFNNPGVERSPIVLHVTQTVSVAEEQADGVLRNGFRRRLHISGTPESATLRIAALPGERFEIADDARSIVLTEKLGRPRIRIVRPLDAQFFREGETALVEIRVGSAGQTAQCELLYVSGAPLDSFPVTAPMPEPIAPVPLEVVPGYKAHRLPLPETIMPTGLAWRDDGTLVFSSLQGRVWLARDADGDGLEDTVTPLSDELAAPYGVAVHGDDVDVICKYGLLRLHDDDRDGHAERTTVLASGWGHTADYHDWAIGLEKDAEGNYYLALPCQQDDRGVAAAHLRGTAIKLAPRAPTAGDPRRYSIEPICSGLRFPMGLALSANGELLATDNQGNYNPFNELNQLLPGRHYGFVNKLDASQTSRPPLAEPAINIPHPWTRSVNGICFLDTPRKVRTQSGGDIFGQWEGHLVGCEYDTRRLIRMSLQRVGGHLQGACYPLSIEPRAGANTFEGPIVCEVAPDGDLYVGNMHDSGWGGGRNTGSIVRLHFTGNLPQGIAEVRAHHAGFFIDFTKPVDASRAALLDTYSVETYRRISTPDYGGPDQNRRVERVDSAQVSADGRRVTLMLEELRAGFVYEIRVRNLAPPGELFFPAEAHYTMKSVPD